MESLELGALDALIRAYKAARNLQEAIAERNAIEAQLERIAVARRQLAVALQIDGIGWRRD